MNFPAQNNSGRNLFFLFPIPVTVICNCCNKGIVKRFAVAFCSSHNTFIGNYFIRGLLTCKSYFWKICSFKLFNSFAGRSKRFTVPECFIDEMDGIALHFEFVYTFFSSGHIYGIVHNRSCNKEVLINFHFLST